MKNNQTHLRSIFARLFRFKSKNFNVLPAAALLVVISIFLSFGKTSFAADMDVAWTNAVGVSVNGNSITKTGSTGTYWTSGASSVASFSGNISVDFTVPQINADVMCGLSKTDSDQNYTSIGYAIYLTGAGAVQIYQSGILIGTFGSYLAWDRFRVERVGTTINYKKNGTIFYTSTVPSSGKLLVDTSIYTGGGVLSDVVISGITLGVADSVTDLNAYSSVGGDIQLNWTAPANNGTAITGYQVQYGTVASGQFASIFNDDAIPGASITGLTNGTAYQFRVVSINSYGTSSASNVVNATPNPPLNVTWTNAVGVSVNGNSITKTSSTAWGNSGAASVAIFSGNGGVDFTVTQTNVHVMCGLSTADPDQNYTTINYALYAAAGTLQVYQNGSLIGSYGSYAAGDRFRVERVGTTVYYKKNGTLLYTSTVASTGKLMVDSALYTNGGVISDAKTIGPRTPDAISDFSAYPWDSTEIRMTWSAPANNGTAITGYQVQYGTVASGQFASTFNDDAIPGASITGLTDGTSYQFRVVAINSYGSSNVSNVVTATPNTPLNVTWTNAVGVSVNSNTITKTSSTAWGNSGAASVATFSGSGGVNFTVTQTNVDVMCGLSNADPDQNYTSINYALDAAAGTLKVYENGSLKGSYGSYVVGDRLRVERVGSTVYYKKNGTLLYTSTVASTSRLMVDSALYTNGGVISDAKIAGFTPGPTDTINDLNASGNSASVQLTWSAPLGNNGAAVSSYQIQYGTVASGAFASTYNDDAIPGATITGLTNGTAYQFRVVAVNSYGNSASSNVANATPNTPLNVTWTNAVGVSVSTNTITKTSATTWGNSGAVSVATFSGNGGVDFTVTQTNTYMMCGLSNADPNQDYTSINYALYAAAGTLQVYQNGYQVGYYFYGSYSAGDRFRIERVGATVYYKKNGVLLYTSTVASTGRLMVDSALDTNGGVISDAKTVGFAPGPTNTITDLSASPGNSTAVQLTWSPPLGNNGAAVSSYQIQYGTVASGAFASTYNDDAIPGATITGLTNGTAYQFRAVAINSYGSSAPSNVQTATPLQKTTVNSDITSNTTWTTSGSPYQITNNINVTSGNTLTINPGVTVQFKGNYYLAVAGTLSAQGQLGSPIVFTSGLATVAPGDWQYISPSGTSTIDYVQLEYSDKGLKIDNVSPSVGHSSFKYNNYGIYLLNGSTSSITHNQISKNNYGIYIYPSLSYTMNPTINYNDIYANTTYDAYASGQQNFSTVTINAKNNWWGTTNTTTIASHIYDRADNANSPLLDISPIAQGSDTVAITSTSVTNQFFDPQAATATINYTLDKAANVTIKIYRDSPNQLVRSLILSQSRSSGSNSQAWDGKDDAGQALADDTYYYTIYAQDSQSRFGQYDPLYVPGTVTIQNPSVTAPTVLNVYRGDTAAISYQLTQPALVTIKVGRAYLIPYDRLLVNKKAQNTSTQNNTWDGRGDSGGIAEAAPYYVFGWADLLKDNAVVIQRPAAVSAVSSIATNPYAFTPLYNEVTNVEYYLTSTQTVTVRVKNPSGAVIKTLVSSQSQGSGAHTATWYGDNASGQKMSTAGTYSIEVETTSGSVTSIKNIVATVFN